MSMFENYHFKLSITHRAHRVLRLYRELRGVASKLNELNQEGLHNLKHIVDDWKATGLLPKVVCDTGLDVEFKFWAGRLDELKKKLDSERRNYEIATRLGKAWEHGLHEAPMGFNCETKVSAIQTDYHLWKVLRPMKAASFLPLDDISPSVPTLNFSDDVVDIEFREWVNPILHEKLRLCYNEELDTLFVRTSRP